MGKDYLNGFQRGWSQVLAIHSKEVRSALLDALGVKSRTSFYYYLRGINQCSAVQAEKVEEVFNRFSITEVWGK